MRSCETAQSSWDKIKARASKGSSRKRARSGETYNGTNTCWWWVRGRRGRGNHRRWQLGEKCVMVLPGIPENIKGRTALLWGVHRGEVWTEASQKPFLKGKRVPSLWLSCFVFSCFVLFHYSSIFRSHLAISFRNSLGHPSPCLPNISIYFPRIHIFE